MIPTCHPISGVTSNSLPRKEGRGGAIMVSATSSGCGKTTFTMGLLRCLRNRGYVVQPFKCGPDYIDTMWHTLASGRESVNLDTWLSSPEHVNSLFHSYGADAEVCVAEGVMGLFDGFDRQHGSCAEIAKLCNLPVILLVNAKSTAYSAAATIYGFTHFDPEVRVAGVVFNQVSGESHFSYLKTACDDAGVRCFGYIKKTKDIELPSRHLGLTIDEKYRIDEYMERVAQLVEATVDVDAILALASSDSTLCASSERCDSHHEGDVSHIGGGGVTHTDAGVAECKYKTFAVARDSAFNFTYRANIDALKRMGEVRFFSPINDAALPEGTDFLYLPGGYPEFYLGELSANSAMLRSVRDYIAAGGAGMAECGGMLYLCKDVVGIDGNTYPMAGVLNLRGTFEGMKLHLGYRSLRAKEENLNFGRWLTSGHEFHYSDIVELPGGEESVGEQFSAKGSAVATKLYRKHNFYAGYTHWYWADKSL